MLTHPACGPERFREEGAISVFSAIVQVELYTYWGTQASPLNIESSLGYLSSKKKPNYWGSVWGGGEIFNQVWFVYEELRWVFSQKKKKKELTVFSFVCFYSCCLLCVCTCVCTTLTNFPLKKNIQIRLKPLPSNTEVFLGTVTWEKWLFSRL